MDLYDDIPPFTDKKPEGGGGSGGRNRFAIKEDEFGPRATRVFVDAVQNDLLSRSQAVEYMDIPDAAFDDLAGSFFVGALMAINQVVWVIDTSSIIQVKRDLGVLVRRVVDT